MYNWREGYDYPSDPEPDNEPDFLDRADEEYEKLNEK
jgi:hypothetical protein